MQHIEQTPFPRKNKIWRTYALQSDYMVLFNEAVAEAEAASKLPNMERVKLLTYRYYSIRYWRFFEEDWLCKYFNSITQDFSDAFCMYVAYIPS